MGDWDFLYEMRERGFSSEEIADAAASGAAPWEWEAISAEWIHSQLDGMSGSDTEPEKLGSPFGSSEGLSSSMLEQAEIFHDLVDCARRHFENTGRYLQIWGELGEIYAEIRFGLRRHATHEAGSDGFIAGKLVEVKTISPEKSKDRVLVKRQGDFEQLLVVRIDEDFQFGAKLLDRSELRGASGRFLKARFRNDES